MCCCCFFFFKQKTAYEMRISDGVQTCALPISVSGGSFLSNATYGGQSPTRQNVVTGALAPAQYSIFQLVDFTSQTGTVTSTIALPPAVPGAQFRLFDVDYAAGQFADRVEIGRASCRGSVCQSG